MGLFTLALIGGAGYVVVKKMQKNNHKRCGDGQCGHHAQNREVNNFHKDFNTTQQYYDYTPEKQAPQYREEPVPTYSYPNEKASMQEIKN